MPLCLRISTQYVMQDHCVVLNVLPKFQHHDQLMHLVKSLSLGSWTCIELLSGEELAERNPEFLQGPALVRALFNSQRLAPWYRWAVGTRLGSRLSFPLVQALVNRAPGLVSQVTTHICKKEPLRMCFCLSLLTLTSHVLLCLICTRFAQFLFYFRCTVPDQQPSGIAEQVARTWFSGETSLLCESSLGSAGWVR